MIARPGPAIERASIGGLDSLRFAKSSKIGQYPPAIPAQFTNTVIEKVHAPKRKKRGGAFLTPEQVSNTQFIAQAGNRYRGEQKGPTGSDMLELPLAWNPVLTASYRPEVAGNAFESGSGDVADLDNLDTSTPKMDPQWRTKGSFLTPDAPNPFPIQLSDKFRIH